MNEILWTPKALKQLREIPKDFSKKIFDKVSELKGFPAVHLDIKRLQGRDGYRLRVGRYRVIFDYNRGIKVVKIEEVKKRDERTYE